MNTIKKRLALFFKGMAMGAADIVPGVSGGTIAFITGIYDELIDTISSIKPGLLRVLFKQGIPEFWKQSNAGFLFTLIVGILASAFSLVHVVNYMLVNHILLLWSFFFGLVLASIFLVGKKVNSWRFDRIGALIIGSVLAYYLTVLPPMMSTPSLLFVALSGMIAICAMILPGISGSFILLLLGSYEVVILAIKNLDFKVFVSFALGAIVGLLAFSRVLKYLFTRFHDLTVALLTGFLIGSLNKLWPWKENKQLLYTHSDGREEWFQTSVGPDAFAGDSMLTSCILAALIGAVVIWGIEFLSVRLSKK